MSSRPLKCALALALLAVCKPDEPAFFEKTFFCDASRQNSQCGTTEGGAALSCFGGKQLGAGRDFCVEPCAGGQGSEEGGETICLAGKAKLKTCRPSEKTADDPDGCGPNLACLRTDLLRDEGVCLAIRVCTSDTDCKDPALSTCASTVLKGTLPRAPFLTDNLQCVVGGCKARMTACPLGETCLTSVVPSTTSVPDICVPSCDSNLDCPPNYACWKRFSGPASPSICLPTLAGARCSSSIDCMVGECLDTGEGFSLCSLPCESDADCVPFSETTRKMFCVQTKKDKRYCIPVSPFAGAYCLTDSNCPAGQTCSMWSPFWPNPTPLGECRLPCGSEDRCAVRSGLPHACFVRGGTKSCYPGMLGVTCQRSEECLTGLTCEPLLPEQRLAMADGGAGANPDGGAPAETTRLCTRPCKTDVDCLDLWKSQESYCEVGWCRMADGANGPCTRDEQCGRGTCPRAPGATSGNCVYPPRGPA